MWLTLFLVLAGCAALYAGGELLLRGALATGTRLGISPALVGLLLVSLGTSAPELFVSVDAALHGYGDIAAGNVVGSNIVNLMLVLGIASVLAPLVIAPGMRRIDLPFLAGLTLLSVVILFDGQVSRLEGVMLLLAGAASLWLMVSHASDDDTEAEAMPDAPMRKAILALIAGVILLVIGAEALVNGGHDLAILMGVPDSVIALSVTALGTGLPEVTATVLAVAKRQTALAIGNIVGSNLLNLGLVLGLSAVVIPLDSSGLGKLTLSLMLLLTVMLWVLSIRPGGVPRMVGAGLLLGYLVFVPLLFS